MSVGLYINIGATKSVSLLISRRSICPFSVIVKVETCNFDLFGSSSVNTLKFFAATKSHPVEVGTEDCLKKLASRERRQYHCGLA